MEVPTTTVHAIASTSTSALHQSNGRRAGASSEPTTSDRFKRELVDRSFDLGEQGDDDDDQDYDSDALEDALYTRNGSSSIAGSSSIKHKAPARDEDEDEDAVMQAALEELSKDAFSEAEVDSMLQELKEIGQSFLSLRIAPCPSTPLFRFPSTCPQNGRSDHENAPQVRGVEPALREKVQACFASSTSTSSRRPSRCPSSSSSLALSW